MKKKLQPKTDRLTEIKAVKTYDDLLRIDWLRIYIDDSPVNTANDYCLLDDLGTSLFIEYKPNGARIKKHVVSCKIIEQPSCCANVYIHDFYVNEEGLPCEIALIALLKLSKYIAVENDYSTIKMTHREDHFVTKVAREAGFKVRRRYINKRHNSKLNDLVLAI